MTQPTLASVSDLAALVDHLDGSADQARASVVLKQASGLVRQAAGQPDDPDSTDAWVDGDGNAKPVPVVAWTITLEAAKRGWNNPSGLGSFTIDDYTERPGDAAIAGLELTEAELAALAKLRPSGSTGFGGISVMSTTRDVADPLLDTTWVRVLGEPDDELFPLYPAEGPIR
jgi:hypothetical protein